MREGMYRLLIYDYVDDIVARRDPHRAGHLENIARHVADGLVVAAGAVGVPPHAGHIVFSEVDDDAIRSFVDGDPYMAAGLITGWRVEPWNVVAVAEH